MHAIANQPVAQIHTPKLNKFLVRAIDDDGCTQEYEALFKDSWAASDDAMVRFSAARLIDVRPV